MDKRDKVAILGFGATGRAVFDYLRFHGFANITVCDQNVDLKAEFEEGVSAKLGPDYLEGLSEFDVIFRSPGVKYLEPEIQAAVNAGKKVISEMAYFIDQCPCPIIGVSGTKGKGTTCTLIYEMLKKAGMDVHLGGNIGKPAIGFLDTLKGDDIVVLEMSSFQLQDLTKSPRYAILLNTTSAHLDYHADQEEYVQAKESILSKQSENAVAILNQDYEYFKHYKSLVQGDLRLVSRGKKVESGAFVDDDEIVYAMGGEEEKICDVADVKLIGSHNLENVMPAVVVAKELGVKKSDIVSVIKTFAGLPHRLELVRELRGVRYFNDSFATVPESSMAAVDSFDEPTVLIAGGFEKGVDYNDWAVKILTKPNLHTVILMGETAERMEEALVAGEEKLGEAEGSPTKVIRRGSLQEAVVDAFAEVEEGGVVVMSPGAASFDMFKDYKERGNEFRKEVRRLK